MDVRNEKGFSDATEISAGACCCLSCREKRSINGYSEQVSGGHGHSTVGQAVGHTGSVLSPGDWWARSSFGAC